MPHRPSSRRSLAGLALLALAGGGCTMVGQQPAPNYAAIPVQAAPGYAAPGYAGASYPAPAYAAGYQPALRPGTGLSRADPYCREAVQEARAATQEASLAAQDAARSAYAGAPGWAQAQDSQRAQDAAGSAERARGFAARDC